MPWLGYTSSTCKCIFYFYWTFPDRSLFLYIEIVCAFLCSINHLRRFDDYCTFFSNVDKCRDYHKVRTVNYLKYFLSVWCGSCLSPISGANWLIFVPMFLNCIPLGYRYIHRVSNNEELSELLREFPTNWLKCQSLNVKKILCFLFRPFFISYDVIRVFDFFIATAFSTRIWIQYFSYLF